MSRALVTGVGRRGGIGAALALGLAEDGWDLALSYWHPYDDRVRLGRSTDDLRQLTEQIRSLGRQVVLLPADLDKSRLRRPWWSPRQRNSGRCPASSWRTARA